MLGCVVQCSIGNWATADVFVGCVHDCINSSSSVAAADEKNKVVAGKEILRIGSQVGIFSNKGEQEDGGVQHIWGEQGLLHIVVRSGGGRTVVGRRHDDA